MEITANLSLPYIMPSQAQKHVTHNEALRALDALVQLAILDRDLAVPPDAPGEGDRYIVAAEAAGAWEGRDGSIAVWQDGDWTFLDPRPGWTAFVLDEAVLVHFSESRWATVESKPELQNLPRLGIGTVADEENPFAARLNKLLWAALATGEGGSGDLRCTFNKEGAGKVLSLLMQSGWSGRAEIGLIGNDDLTVKVSANGSDWTDALKVDRASGRVAFPRTNLLSDFAVSLLPDSGRFAGDAANSTTIGAYAFPSYLTLSNGATASDGGKYNTNNNDYGGTSGALPAHAKELIDKIRTAGQRRYGVEWRMCQITMGSETSSPLTVAGKTTYSALYYAFGPRAPGMTAHAYLRALDQTIVWQKRDAAQTMFRDGTIVDGHVVVEPSDGWVSVACRDLQDPYMNNGYNPTPMTLRMVSAGDRMLVACLALMGGITPVDPNTGVIAGIKRWLP